MIKNLPIHTHLPSIKKALETSRCAVVQAPPGAGKTTQVPLALLNEPWLTHKKIILLEPRRLAAISCASHMADLVEEKVGQTIGYQIRLDSKISKKTRIEVITEGIFTRIIQNDPSLEGVGLVIFDEFHERNIHSDLGLALCLESFEALRDDLRILVMSATMDVSSISALIGQAPVIASKGKSYPVETIYLPPVNTQGRKVTSIESDTAAAVHQAVLETHGDILVFLPGVGEIKRLASILDKNQNKAVVIIPLYGQLSQKDQANAFKPLKKGMRKIVLSTSIAETSITIPGIRVVIDSGQMRVPKFSPQTGMSRLETMAVSKASADQRRGRAGRTASGVCYRVWSEYTHGLLKSYTRPEILSVDLTGLALELAAWGLSGPGQLKWLDPPEKKAFEKAQILLKTLGALDQQGHATIHGKKMASVGLHPRLAHMVIKGKKNGHGPLACRIAAFLNERDFIRFDRYKTDPDIRVRLELIEMVTQKKQIFQKECRINKGIIYRIIQSEQKLLKDFRIKKGKINIENAGVLLAHAYPDRIAKKRDNQNNTFLTASGKGVFFPDMSPVAISEYIVALHLDGNPKNAKIYLAAPYSKESLEQDFGTTFKTVESVFWDKKTNSVKAREDILFKKIIVDQQILLNSDPELASDILIKEIQKAGVKLLPWTKNLESIKERAVFLKNTGQFPDLPDVSDKAIEKNLAIWLTPFLSGILSFKQLEGVDLKSAFLSQFSWKQQNLIEKMAPTHIVVPSGSKKPLKYSDKNGNFPSPVLEVRLQEMFGLTDTPKIAGKTILVTLHLLSPAGRPVQITTDLKNFWANTYKDVKKDLMGRYPKHFWPDDPFIAKPTARVKPKVG
ncbi:MAG: ATP-dependent helicase HrpB [Desulfobacteraceae bacterium]|nr:ATP-dependent helicase HrpB [Desulfobacteraceae bacterium]